MGFSPLCLFKFGISPSKSVESGPCKADTIVGCDPARLCNICCLHQFKDWTWATHIINRLILLSGEDIAAKQLYLRNIWELSVDLNVSPPRSSATCHRYSSLNAYLTHRKTKLPRNTNLGLLWGAGGALPPPRSSALRPPATEAQGQAHPHCQAPAWGGVRAEQTARQLQQLLSSHRLRMPTVDDWIGFQYEGPKSAYTWYRLHIFITQGLDTSLRSVT